MLHRQGVQALALPLYILEAFRLVLLPQRLPLLVAGGEAQNPAYPVGLGKLGKGDFAGNQLEGGLAQNLAGELKLPLQNGAAQVAPLEGAGLHGGDGGRYRHGFQGGSRKGFGADAG